MPKIPVDECPAGPAIDAAGDGLLREPEGSSYRFVIAFKDLHILRQWDITQQVVSNDDVGYMRYLIGTFPAPMKEYLIAFVKLFLRAVENMEEPE